MSFILPASTSAVRRMPAPPRFRPRVPTVPPPSPVEETVAEYVAREAHSPQHQTLVRYTEMSIEDYAPYKALNLPVGLYGPAPYRPSTCICGRYMRENGFCLCATSCHSWPDYKWATENPQKWEAEQKEAQAWMRRWQHWLHQSDTVGAEIWKKSKHIHREFEALQDAESRFGCHSCESSGYTSCHCACETCGDKWCVGSCADDQEYL
jgi:hypothetical protein